MDLLLRNSFFQVRNLSLGLLAILWGWWVTANMLAFAPKMAAAWPFPVLSSCGHRMATFRNVTVTFQWLFKS